MVRGEILGRGSKPDAQVTRVVREHGRVVERLEVLTGERGAAGKPQAAVRRGDLSRMTSTMRSHQISSAPTQADFNALQADLAALYEALAKLGKA